MLAWPTFSTPSPLQNLGLTSLFRHVPPFPVRKKRAWPTLSTLLLDKTFGLPNHNCLPYLESRVVNLLLFAWPVLSTLTDKQRQVGRSSMFDLTLCKDLKALEGFSIRARTRNPLNPKPHKPSTTLPLEVIQISVSSQNDGPFLGSPSIGARLINPKRGPHLERIPPKVLDLLSP